MTYKSLLSLFSFCTNFIFAAGSAFAGEVFVGITAQQSTLFISEKNSETDFAEMESNLYFLPALAVRSENKYFNEASNWGHFLEFNAGYYNVNRQVVNGSTVNLQTKLSGHYLDLTPTIFYNFGSREQESWGFKAGLGIGVGYLSTSGSTVLTEKIGQPIATYDDNSFGFTAGLFFEAKSNDWFVQVKGYGPIVEVGDSELQLANIKMTFGKMFDF